MNPYEGEIQIELIKWQKRMMRRPSIISKLAKKAQIKINSWIPEKVHAAITTAIKQMIKAVLFGAKYTSAKLITDQSIEVREAAIRERIKGYRNTAAIEGGITGAGGILLGLADFPILLGIKLKLLFDIASMYGFDVKDYRERIYILHIFELAFSTPQHRREVFIKIKDWNENAKELPEDINQFDWRNLQQEYRDYLDIAKLAQLVPIIGAPVGIVVNYRLVKKLGVTAMNGYRMRIVK